MAPMDAVTKAVLDFIKKRVPKDVEVGKGEIAWMTVGAIGGLAVDLAALPVGIITGGTASAAGAGLGYSGKVAFDNARDKFGHRKARHRAEATRELFEKAGFTAGVKALDVQLELHEKKIKKNRNKMLDLAVDAQVAAFEKFTSKG